MVASYQDIRERAVADLAWLPALVGVLYAFYALYPAIEFLALKIGLMGGLMVVFLYMGQLGQADAIALVFVAADPFPLSLIPIPLAAGVLLLAHFGYNRLRGRPTGTATLPMERFLKEQHWIPRALIKDGTRIELDRDVNVARNIVEKDPEAGSMVEVEYGVPTVAYLGIGYLLFLLYLILFNPATFLALP